MSGENQCVTMQDKRYTGFAESRKDFPLTQEKQTPLLVVLPPRPCLDSAAFSQTAIHFSEMASFTAAERHHLFESLSNGGIKVCKRCCWTTEAAEISTHSFRTSSSPTDRFGRFPEPKAGTHLLFTSPVLESMLVLTRSDIESLHADPFTPPRRFLCSNLIANYC